MSALQTLSMRPQLWAAALLLLLTAALAIVLAAAAPAVAAVLTLLVAAGAATLGLVLTAVGRPARPAPRAEIPAEEVPPTLRLTLPDGATVVARPVTLGGAAETTLLLTRDGYVVVDDGGRVLYRL